MKRGLVFTLCALAAMATASLGRAQTIDLTLNLRFNDPADPTEGGVWYLLAKTTGGTTNAGIAGVSAYLLGINPTAFHGSSVPLPAGQNPAHHSYPVVGQATINNINDDGSPYNGATSGAHNVVYGQDNSNGPPVPPPLITGIGQGSGAGNVTSDPLKNSTYDNYAVLLSGTFAGGATAATLPRFAPDGAAATNTDGNVLASGTAGAAALPAAIAAAALHVRGDSLGTLNLNSVAGAGLRGGDANRDQLVNIADFGVLQTNVGTGGKTWDQADFNDDGNVNIADFGVIQTNLGAGTPPSISAVPEPAALAMAGFAAIGGLLAVRRRRG